VKRDFTAERPGVKFGGDITCIHTWQGLIYATSLFDRFSKKVVGWSIADCMRTELVEDSLANAARTTVIERKAIFHSTMKVFHLGCLSDFHEACGHAFLDG
jgi:transposase InsO family protein